MTDENSMDCSQYALEAWTGTNYMGDHLVSYNRGKGLFLLYFNKTLLQELRTDPEATFNHNTTMYGLNDWWGKKFLRTRSTRRLRSLPSVSSMQNFERVCDFSSNVSLLFFFFHRLPAHKSIPWCRKKRHFWRHRERKGECLKSGISRWVHADV